MPWPLLVRLSVDFLSSICHNLTVAVIENLPMEMRDRFTEMREMDLQVAS